MGFTIYSELWIVTVFFVAFLGVRILLTLLSSPLLSKGASDAEAQRCKQRVRPELKHTVLLGQHRTLKVQCAARPIKCEHSLWALSGQWLVFSDRMVAAQ
jgi:1,4-dihydroxy-2-naphthoate octaprenyltransferase